MAKVIHALASGGQSTICGRKRDAFVRQDPDGTEIWANGTHQVTVVPAGRKVSCARCREGL